MNIILLGYRGSGKSTLGKKLADHLWMKFVDTDQEVRKKLGGQTVAEIWETLGQDKWRDVEAEVVQEVCQGDGKVIALGGGALTRPEAFEAVRTAKGAVRIYLQCTAEELQRRVAADAGSGQSRPALTEHGGGIEEIQQVLAERDPIYRKAADKVFEVTHLKPDGAFKHFVDRCL